MAAQYQFRPLVEGDLPMVRQWLQVPEVARWWGDPVEQFGLVSGDMGEPAMDQYIVSSTQAFGAPFGYLQCYRLTDWNICFGSQPEHTRGIDQMIGEPDMIECGHGSGFIRAFTENLLAYGLGRVLKPEDMTTVRAVARDAAKSNNRIYAFVMSIVKSTPFQMRAAAGSTVVAHR